MAEYIDKQAFLDYMRGTNRYFTVKCDIESFPTVDVAPVVYGRWGASWWRRVVLLYMWLCHYH